MNNAPFVISAKGMFHMEKHDEFRRSIYKKFRLRPVFRIQQEWAAARFEKEDKVAVIAGHPISGISYRILTEQEIREKHPNLPEQPSDEEIEEFLRIENEWIAEQILYEYGWNEFEKECQHSHLSQEFHDKFRACDAKDKQCHLLCPGMIAPEKCTGSFTITWTE